jgi:hypothetical protein
MVWLGSEGQGSPLGLLLLDGDLWARRHQQNDSAASWESLYGCGVKRGGFAGQTDCQTVTPEVPCDGEMVG